MCVNVAGRSLTYINDDGFRRGADQRPVSVVNHHAVLGAGGQAADDVTGDVLLSEGDQQVT